MQTEYIVEIAFVRTGTLHAELCGDGVLRAARRNHSGGNKRIVGKPRFAVRIINVFRKLNLRVVSLHFEISQIVCCGGVLAAENHPSGGKVWDRIESAACISALVDRQNTVSVGAAIGAISIGSSVAVVGHVGDAAVLIRREIGCRRGQNAIGTGIGGRDVAVGAVAAGRPTVHQRTHGVQVVCVHLCRLRKRRTVRAAIGRMDTCQKCVGAKFRFVAECRLIGIVGHTAGLTEIGGIHIGVCFCRILGAVDRVGECPGQQIAGVFR